MKLSLHSIKQRTAPLVWLLASMLLLFPVSMHVLPGIVLCIEADGHVTIEDALGLSCGPDASPHEHADDTGEAFGHATEASHCGSCIDIPLRVEGDEDCASFRLERAPKVDPVSPTPAVLPFQDAESRVAAVPTPSASDIASDRSHLAPLRSVVLLL